MYQVVHDIDKKHPCWMFSIIEVEYDSRLLSMYFIVLLVLLDLMVIRETS